MTADSAVLTEAPPTVPIERFHKIPVEKSIVEGSVVWSACLLRVMSGTACGRMCGHSTTGFQDVRRVSGKRGRKGEP